jgi:hypothetical protein
MTDSDEINQLLETQKKVLSHKEYLDLLFKILEENPSKEIFWLLRADLLAHAYVDRNRVANYLAQFLTDPNPYEREAIVHALIPLALRPEDDAYKILHEFLGEVPTKENRKMILSERLRQLRVGKH